MLKIAAVIFLMSAGLHSANGTTQAFVTDPPRLAVGDRSCSKGAAPCHIRFTGSDNLYPGGPPAQSEIELAYLSHSQPASVRLYVSKFDGRSPLSSPLCTALTPAALFEVAVQGQGQRLFAGSLDTLVRLASAPTEGLLVPAPRGHPHWIPGDREPLRISIGLDPSADNSYMGCSVEVAFGWLVST
jgi:hypothetical protein